MLVIALTWNALNHNHKEQVAMSIVHPDYDPKFADLTQSGYKPPNQYEAILGKYAGINNQSPHETEYGVALDSYEREASLYATEVSAHREARDILAGWAVVCAVVFSLSLLPWARWGGKLNKSGMAVAEEATKLGAHSVIAIKAMSDPSPIVGRSGFTSYSVADELEKWSKLRNEGVVTEAEFEEARARLLRRDANNN